MEVRYGGVDVLADPGTYCYHGEPEWRSYFRSTIAHSTVEIGGRNQSAESGPFMWSRHARTLEIDVPDAALNWTAEHDGYGALRPRAWHRRSVRLDPASRAIDIADVIDGGGHEVRMAFNFGPLVRVSLDGSHADLSWPEAAVPGSARLELPAGLEWRVHQGSMDPILGWYSDGLGRKTPAVALIGAGLCRRDTPLITRLEFVDVKTDAYPGSARPEETGYQRRRVSLGLSAASVGPLPDIRAEVPQ